MFNIATGKMVCEITAHSGIREEKLQKNKSKEKTDFFLNLLLRLAKKVTGKDFRPNIYVICFFSLTAFHYSPYFNYSPIMKT